MGWQSYICFYSNENEKTKILDVIRKHNDPKTDFNIVGEDLFMITDAVLTPNNEKEDQQETRRAILCGNGGGRSITFRFFQDNNIRCVPYDNTWTIKEQHDLFLT